jgi:cell division protein FtsI (penicillin-binding protein 3)
VKLNFYKDDSLKQRKLITIILFASAFAILFIRLSILTFSHEDYGHTLNIPQVERGSIYDRSGRLLAEQLETFDVSLWLPDLRNAVRNESPEAREERLKKTAALFSFHSLVPQEELYERMTDTQGPATLVLTRNSDIGLKDAFERIARENNVRGLQIESKYNRFYPNGSLASNLLGYVNNDDQGGEGLEYSFERILAPPALGSRKRVSSGNSLELTIDANLQGIVERRVKKAFTEHNARSAIAIIADAKNGAVLSYVSLPTFDSNFYYLSATEERVNRPVAEAYEPGSVFKIFSIGAILDSGLISPDEKFFCNGFYETVTPGGQRIVIKCQGVHGWQTPEQILSNSCNTGTALISERITANNLYHALLMFGFGKKTMMPLAGETAGILAAPATWSGRSKPTISIGQEVAVSAMQLVQAATVFSNSGQMIKPQLIKRVIAPDGTVLKDFKREVIREVLQAETADTLLHILKAGVEQGIARRMYIEGLEIAAKTGTSQTYDAETGTYSSSDYIASALAYVPADAPQYIIYIAFNRPLGASYFGAGVVAPLIRNIVLDLIPYAGLNMRQVEKHAYKKELAITPAIEKSAEITELPDFAAFATRYQMLAFARQNNIRLKFYGNDGAVTSQFPPPGTLISPHITVAIFTGDHTAEQEENKELL